MAKLITHHINIIIVAHCLVLGGCASSPTPNPETVEIKKQLIELQRVTGAQSAQIEELNNKILLLKDKIDNKSEVSPNTPGEPVTVLQPKEPPVAPLPSPISTERKPPVTVEPLPEAGGGKPNGADKIYSRALIDARKPALTSLEHDVDLLFKSYKDSPLTNNALFLLAQTQFERGQFTQSAAQFEKLYKAYPDGNKAVGALYRLGLCYEKMGHPNEANEAFQNVISVYPGSAEALEAEKRLKQKEGIK